MTAIALLRGCSSSYPTVAVRTHAHRSPAMCTPAIGICSAQLRKWHQDAACLRRPAQCRAGSHAQQLDRRRGLRRGSTCTYPEPETEKERSSVDFPQEWMTPQPSRRPDVMPEFEKLETPMPRKLPGDPEVPDEEEEEEEDKKKKDPDKEDPEKEKPDAPPSE